MLGLGCASVIALVLALGAVNGTISAGAAAAGCIGLAFIAAASFGIPRTPFGARLAESHFVAAQLAAVFVLLAALTYHAPFTISVLYVIALLYGALRLEPVRLVMLGAFGLALHGAALYLLIRDSHPVIQSSAGTQLAALALAFALFAYAAGDVQRLRSRLADARRELHDIGIEARERASRDALTGAYHRAYLIEALEREMARAERTGKPLSVARADLDGLGAVNDAHGSAAGDVALRRFAAVAEGALRDVDLLGRYGGKEFLVLMPDTDLAGSLVAAERLRAAIAKEPVPEVDGRRELRCTLGVAEHRHGENARQLLGRAEANLAYGKAAGRDRVIANAGE